MDQTLSFEGVDITKSQAPQYVKFAFLCAYKRNIPKWIGLLCFIINHLQTLALILKNANLGLKREDETSLGRKVGDFYLKILIPNQWFTEDDTSVVNILLFVTFAYVMTVLLLSIYLHAKIYFRSKIPDFIQALISSIHYFHSLILFFPIHVFALEFIKRYYQDTFPNDFGALTIVLLYFILVINSIFEVTMAKFYVMIKIKDPLSSKTNFIRNWDQGTKAAVGILWLFTEDLEWLKILLLLMSLIDIVLKDYGFFYVLPYYRIQTLVIGAIMQAGISNLALLTVIAKILSIINLDVGKSFVLCSWVVLTPLVMIMYYVHLWKTLVWVAFARPEDLNRYQVIHKRYVIRYFMKKRIEPHRETRKFDWFYYMYISKAFDLLAGTDISIGEFSDNKRLLQMIIKTLMIMVIDKHPKNELYRINLAYFYIKYENSYLLANNLIEEVLKNGPSFPALVSLSFIHLELQKKLLLEYSDQEDSEGKQGLNIMKYVQVHGVYSKMKNQLTQQIKQQTHFWNHFLSPKADMGVLVDICSKINQEKRNLEKIWNKLCRVNDSKFSSPTLMYGLYQCFVNNDSVTGEKYIEFYHNNTLKYNVLTQRDELTDNTLFSEENVQIAMSGLKNKLGRILDCSSNIYEVFGWKRSFLVDRPINLIMPPYYRERHDEILMRYYNTGNAHLLNKTVVLPIIGSDGYVHQSWAHIKISPLVESGLSYVAIIRPVKNKKYLVYIRRDGTIDAMSKEFAEDMNILNHDKDEILNICSFCPNFHIVNEAFNETTVRNMREASSKSVVYFKYNRESSMKPQNGILTAINTQTDILPEEILTQRHPSLRRSKSPVQTMIKSFDHEKKIKEVFEKFTNGSKLIFYPQTNNKGESSSKIFIRYKSNLEPIIYNARIQTMIHEKDFIKMMVLERESDNNIENEAERQHKIDQNNSFIENQIDDQTISKEEHLTPRYGPTNNSFNDEPVEMSILDEKQTPDAQEKKISKEDLLTTRENLIQTHHPEETQTYRGQETVLMTLGKGESSTRNVIKNSHLQNNGPINLLSGVANHVSGRDKFKMIVNQARGIKGDVKNKSSVEAHDRNPKKREYTFKIKLKQLREKLNRGILDMVKAEGSISSSYLSRGTKIQGLITQALRMENKKKSAIMFFYSFFVFILVSLALDVFQNTNMQFAIQDVQIRTSVIEKGFFRIKKLIVLAGNVRQWDQVVSGTASIFNWEIDNQLLRDSVGPALQELLFYNNALRTEVSKIDKNFQGLFFTKDVKIFERREDNSLELVSTDSNFEAIQSIVNKGLRFFNTKLPSSFNSSINRQDLLFILDNTYNDLLISSENSVQILLKGLYIAMEDIKTYLTLLFGLILSAAGIFILVCLRYLYKMRSNAESFMVIFFRLDPKGVQETKSILKNFVDSLESNMLDLQVSEENEEKLNGEKNQAKNQKIFRRASMDRLYRKMFFLFAKLSPFLLAFIGWNIIYYFLAIHLVSDINLNQIQIQSSLETQILQELVVKELVEIVTTNSTAKIRNNPIETDFMVNLNAIQKTEELLDKFKAKDNSLTQSQEEIFFNFPCNYFFSELAYGFMGLQESCERVSKGTGSIGLVNLNAETYILASQMYDDYRTSNKSVAELGKFSYQLYQNLADPVNLATNLLDRLHQATSVNFQDKVAQVEKDAIIFTVVAVVATSVCSVILFFGAIKNIIEYDTKDRQLLQLVPIQQILSNRYLKQHLVKNSNGSLDIVKRFI